MAKVDEAEQQRETYGDAPGWSASKAVLPEGQTVKSLVQSKASPEAPAPDAEAASSADVVEQTPEQEQVPEQAPPTPSQPEPAPKVWHQPPPERWEELRQQREAAERRAQQAEELARLAMERTQAPPAPTPPQVDPWEGLVNHPDPATAQYWQLQRKLMVHEREQGKQEAIQALRPVIEAGTSEIARLNLKDFRKENPEIKPASEEERLVVAYMNGQMDGVRHPLESAKRNALFDKIKSENESLKQKQSATPLKRQAAATEASAGMPQTNGLPRQRSTATDRAGELVEKGASLKDIAKAFFG